MLPADIEKVRESLKDAPREIILQKYLDLYIKSGKLEDELKECNRQMAVQAENYENAKEKQKQAEAERDDWENKYNELFVKYIKLDEQKSDLRRSKFGRTSEGLRDLNRKQQYSDNDEDGVDEDALDLTPDDDSDSEQSAADSENKSPI